MATIPVQTWIWTTKNSTKNTARASRMKKRGLRAESRQ